MSEICTNQHRFLQIYIYIYIQHQFSVRIDVDLYYPTSIVAKNQFYVMVINIDFMLW